VGSGADLILWRREKSLALCQESNHDSSAIRPAIHLYIKVANIVLEILEVMLVFGDVQDSKLHQKNTTLSFIVDLCRPFG
jgi:hypothetical protein